MFGITSADEYFFFYQQLTNQQTCCILFVFVGFLIILCFGLLWIFTNDKIDSNRDLYAFIAFIGLLAEIIAFGVMVKIENDIGKLNQEWIQYRLEEIIENGENEK